MTREQAADWPLQVVRVTTGGSAEFRIRATAEECAVAVSRLQGLFDVVSVSEQYPDAGASRLVRVFVEVRL